MLRRGGSDLGGKSQPNFVSYETKFGMDTPRRRTYYSVNSIDYTLSHKKGPEKIRICL